MEVKFDNKFTPQASCVKCGGTGFKTKKKTKTESKQKPCKLCVQASGFCPKCNNTGEKPGKPGKICKCKKDKLKIENKTKQNTTKVLN